MITINLKGFYQLPTFEIMCIFWLIILLYIIIRGLYRKYKTNAYYVVFNFSKDNGRVLMGAELIRIQGEIDTPAGLLSVSETLKEKWAPGLNGFIITDWKKISKFKTKRSE